MPLPTAVLFQTHFFDRWAARQFERIRRGCPPHYFPFVVMHAPPGTPKPDRLADVPHHFVTTPEIKNRAYPRKVAEDDWTGRPWHFWDGGHCDLIPLHFFNAHPHFERYWVIEFDVHFTGPWRRLFDTFERSEADLLTTIVRRRQLDADWVCWPSMQGPAPAEEIERHSVAAFLPIFRASRRAMETMDAAYRAGWGGHVEASWSTILNFHGLTLEDIGGDGEFVAPGNRRRFYTSSPSTSVEFHLAPGTVFAKPVMHRPGSRPDTLYHPVKPFRLWPELKAAIKDARVWQGARRRELVRWLSARLAALHPAAATASASGPSPSPEAAPPGPDRERPDLVGATHVALGSQRLDPTLDLEQERARAILATNRRRK